MEITMKEPGTEMDVTLQVVPEDYNGEQRLRIIYPSKDSFVMIQKGGEWKVVDEEHISPEIISAINEELRTHARYNSL